jgi:FMN phosphatase YigB (HAD superfamily)
MVRALVLDVFGTLVDWRSGVADAFQGSGVPGDPEELADGWRARYRRLDDVVLDTGPAVRVRFLGRTRSAPGAHRSTSSAPVRG